MISNIWYKNVCCLWFILSSFLLLVIFISIVRIVLVSYVKENVDSLVNFLGVVLHTHNAKGNYFTHYLSYNSTFFSKFSNIIVYGGSTCPFLCGYLGVENTCFMPLHCKHFSNFDSINCDPLYETTEYRSLCQIVP